jgi:DNA-binding transcriptional MerR regulator
MNINDIKETLSSYFRSPTPEEQESALTEKAELLEKKAELLEREAALRQRIANAEKRIRATQPAGSKGKISIGKGKVGGKWTKVLVIIGILVVIVIYVVSKC